MHQRHRLSFLIQVGHRPRIERGVLQGAELLWWGAFESQLSLDTPTSGTKRASSWSLKGFDPAVRIVALGQQVLLAIALTNIVDHAAAAVGLVCA